MIDVKARIHDLFSVEFKISYTLPQGTASGKASYGMNCWIFVNKSLDISSHTYSRDDFFRDLRSNYRLITPDFPLSSLSSGDSVPVSMLEAAFAAAAPGMDDEACSRLEHAVKMFCSVFKSSLRDACAAASSQQQALMCVSMADAVLKTYRSFAGALSAEGVPQRAFSSYLYGDEFLSCTARGYIGPMCIRTGAGGERLKAISDAEDNYRRRMGYPVVGQGTPEANSAYVFRMGVLKKYVAGVLYLEADKKRDGTVAEQVYNSIAAGAAMVFATAVAWVGIRRYGNYSVPLFVALVLSYMGKDRIKELMRYYFAHKRRAKYFDMKTVFSTGGRKVADMRAGFDFVRISKVPVSVMDARTGCALTPAEIRSGNDRVMLLRKLLRLDTAAVSAADRLEVRGINEIMRLNISSFLRNTDNPDEDLYVFGEEGAGKVCGTRLYYAVIVMQLVSEGKERQLLYRIGFNRRGIVSLEEL